MTKKTGPGRPPRVTSDQIARAALKIGLEKATVKNVASALGMSVPGLYHHVRTREDLIAMATAHAFTLVPTTLHNIDLETFLLEFSRDVFLSIVREPVVIPQLASGNFISSGMALHLEWFLENMERYGFAVDEAYATFAQLMAVIIGAAALQASDEVMRKRNTSIYGELRDIVPSFSDPQIAHVRELVSNPEARHPERLDAIRVIIKAIVRDREKIQPTPAPKRKPAGGPKIRTL